METIYLRCSHSTFLKSVLHKTKCTYFEFTILWVLTNVCIHVTSSIIMSWSTSIISKMSLVSIPLTAACPICFLSLECILHYIVFATGCFHLAIKSNEHTMRMNLKWYFMQRIFRTLCLYSPVDGPLDSFRSETIKYIKNVVDICMKILCIRMHIF